MKKRKLRRLFWGAILLCCVAFAVFYIAYKETSDNTPPVITMDQQELTLSVADDSSMLLQGVTAQDDRDGDVSASLVVESVRGLITDGRFTVTYAAFDRAGNVTKAQRVVHYSDYTSPHFVLNAPLIFKASTALNIFNVVSAEDVFDGTIKDRVKGTLVSEEREIADAGTYMVEFRVSNSLGDTAYLTVPVEVYSGENGSATVALTDYLVYLKKGDSFDPEDYLSRLTAGGRRIDLRSQSRECQMSWDSDVDMKTPGTYFVDYTVEYGSYIGYTRLIVVVED